MACVQLDPPPCFQLYSQLKPVTIFKAARLPTKQVEEVNTMDPQGKHEHTPPKTRHVPGKKKWFQDVQALPLWLNGPFSRGDVSFFWVTVSLYYLLSL